MPLSAFFNGCYGALLQDAGIFFVLWDSRTLLERKALEEGNRFLGTQDFCHVARVSTADLC